ncbi:hypothetical protein DFH09DRAFT_1096456 [Mycena vulgaris]|nr:hypothetical protein DFH09DRAFT_1096456 [Mycena vulgaris]
MSSPLPYPDLFALLVEVQFGAAGPQTTQLTGNSAGHALHKLLKFSVPSALGHLIAKNAPIKVENAVHAKLLCKIIDIFRVVAFWKYVPSPYGSSIFLMHIREAFYD